MSAIPRQTEPPVLTEVWQPEVLQILDEEHLVAWSSSPEQRVRFASALTNFIDGLHDAEVFVLHGRFMLDIDSFCHQLERLIPGERLERRIDGPHGIVSMLRGRPVFPGRPASRYRFFIWHDADAMLNENPRLFGRLVDAMLGVAAESEFVDDDLLLLQRAVFVGGPSLERYAREPGSQFRSWFDDGHAEPFWRTVTGQRAPLARPLRIESLESDAELQGWSVG